MPKFYNGPRAVQPKDQGNQIHDRKIVAAYSMDRLQLLYFVGLPLTSRSEFEFYELLKQCKVDSLENNEAIALRVLKAFGSWKKIKQFFTVWPIVAGHWVKPNGTRWIKLTYLL